MGHRPDPSGLHVRDGGYTLQRRADHATNGDSYGFGGRSSPKARFRSTGAGRFRIHSALSWKRSFTAAGGGEVGEIVVNVELEDTGDRDHFERGHGQESDIRRTSIEAIVDTGAIRQDWRSAVPMQSVPVSPPPITMTSRPSAESAGARPSRSALVLSVR